MLVAVLCGVFNMNASADTYEQLTSIANIDESAQYVLGIDGTGFHYEGTSSWGKTALPSAQTPIYYTLTKAADGASFTAKAIISETEYYLQVPTSNTFSMATSAGTNTDLIIGTTQVSGTNYAVANKTTTARHLRINGTSGLRSYAGTTGSMAFFYKVTKSVSISFTNDFKYIPINGKYTQTPITENANGATITYSSSNTSIASVNSESGEVTGVSAGETSIIASITVSGATYSDSYSIIVYDADVLAVDEIDNALTGVGDATQYSDWIGKTTGMSDAVYAGNSAGTNYSVQLRSDNNNSGIVSTTSGGFLRKIIIQWHGTTQRTVDFYGKNEPYTSPSDLYSTNNQGTKLGSLTYGSSTELSISDNYSYLGIRSANGALYLKRIIVIWEIGSVTPAPVVNANNVEINHDATSGSISYIITNPVEGGTLTATSSEDWLNVGTPSEGSVALSCEANSQTTARTATVTLTYTYGDNQTVTKSVTVTQAAAPLSYSTIPAIFDAATTTATPVYVTFNNWVVSGVSTNGKNVFVTDNNGNGFVIFDNNGGLDNTYQVGDVLSGTAVACKLVLYNGFAEITNLNADDLTITTGGTVTAADIAMADLAGVNTGALVSYDNLTCSVNNNKYYLSDGTTTLQVYNALYAFEALEEGKIYNITGVYQQYNNTKEIMPRSADDIEEVVVTSILADDVSITCDATSGEISYTINNPISGTNLTATEEVDWITSVTVDATNSKVTFTTTANTGAERSGIITLTYGTVTKDVTVSQAAYAAPGNWVLTNLADLSANDVFVIVGTYNVDGSSFAMSNDNGTNAPSAVSVTIAGNTLSGEIADNLQWNISSTTDGYTFYPNGTTETWLYCTNTNNGVKVGTNDANIFVLDSETGYLKHITTSRYVGIYNSQDWRCYSNTTGNTANQSFSFYKKVSETPQPQTVEVTIAAAATDGSVNYGTLYYHDMNLTVPDGVTAYTASVSNGNLTLSEVTGAIPAGTGVVLKTDSKLAKNTTFLFTEATEGGTVDAGNMLLGTDDDDIMTTAPEGSTGTYKFYALSLNGKNAENSIGFYYRKNCPNGEAFVNGKHKAYLAVPVNQAKGMSGFAFDDAATAINGVAFGVETNNAAIYNLNGQRVNKAQKGIYIVNGKKIVIK